MIHDSGPEFFLYFYHEIWRKIVISAFFNNYHHSITYDYIRRYILQDNTDENLINNNFPLLEVSLTSSVIQWSEFLATDTEVPGSIPGATTFSEK
jgi:hypothetical protein